MFIWSYLRGLTKVEPKYLQRIIISNSQLNLFYLETRNHIEVYIQKKLLIIDRQFTWCPISTRSSRCRPKTAFWSPRPLRDNRSWDMAPVLFLFNLCVYYEESVVYEHLVSLVHLSLLFYAPFLRAYI